MTTAQEERTAEELKALAEQAGRDLEDASALEILQWAVDTFGKRFCVTSSMEDAVVAHLASRVLKGVDVVFLDTGYHFAETYGTRDAVETSMDVTIVDITPRQTVAEQDAAHGKDLWSRDPGLCCQLRKVEPLHDRLAGYEVWVTGVRREEAPTRSATPLVTWDEKNGLVKINPLAAWTFDELLAYATKHQVILNPLLNDGYPSIGCAPCTRRVAPGEDPRSGRWAGLDKTECGLHV